MSFDVNKNLPFNVNVNRISSFWSYHLFHVCINYEWQCKWITGFEKLGVSFATHCLLDKSGISYKEFGENIW